MMRDTYSRRWIKTRTGHPSTGFAERSVDVHAIIRLPLRGLRLEHSDEACGYPPFSRAQSGWLIPPGLKPRRGNLFIATPRLGEAKPRRGDLSKPASQTVSACSTHGEAAHNPGAMANTYSQLYIQIVFAVQSRQNLIQNENKEELHKYMTGIVREREQKLLAVHCMPDHTHILIGLKPSMALSDLVRDVKNGSTNFINRNRWVAGRFCWQEGFGAFSYGHSQLTGVINYVRDQERHHVRRSFRDEYLRFLKKYEVEHDERYIFKPLD